MGLLLAITSRKGVFVGVNVGIKTGAAVVGVDVDVVGVDVVGLEDTLAVVVMVGVMDGLRGEFVGFVVLNGP